MTAPALSWALVPGSVWRNRVTGRTSTLRRSYRNGRGTLLLEWEVDDGARSVNCAWPGYFLDRYILVST